MAKKIKKTHPKKELKDKLSIQLHMILASFKHLVDEKKLTKLVKKAGKLLADGLHHKPAKPTAAKKTVAKTGTPAKPKVAAKKAVAKKSAVKKK